MTALALAPAFSRQSLRLSGSGVVRKVLLALAAAMIAVSAITQPVAAANITGPVYSAPAICQVSAMGGGKFIYVPVPAIYASNRTAGAGNDQQTIRYWTRLVDLNGNAPWAWVFAGQGSANDNRAATLPVYSTIGNTAYQHRWGPYSFNASMKAQILVEWWTGSTLLGTLTATLPSYTLWADGFSTPGYKSC